MSQTPEYLQSELMAIELFKKLKYDYFDAKSEMYEVVLEDRLTNLLKRINPWLNKNNLQKVVRKILAVSGLLPPNLLRVENML